MAAKVMIDLPGGLKMPGLGLGTWQSLDEKQLETALNYALEIGYRHIDTAFVYTNEHVIGRVLKQWLDSGKLKRSDLFITTKLPMCGVNPARVEMFIKKSLASLQLDYVDLYLIHFPIGTTYIEGQMIGKMEPNTDHLGIWKKMEEQVDAGRAKTIGISNFNIKQIDRILKAARIKPANLQVEDHVYLQQKELVDFCHKNGVSVVAYSPLGSPGYNKFLVTRGLETKELPNILQDETINQIGKKHNKTTAQIMLRHLIQRNIVPIPKSVTKERLKENIDVFDFTLDADDMKKLNALDVGEAARICDFKVYPGFQEHPEWPFPK